MPAEGKFLKVPLVGFLALSILFAKVYFLGRLLTPTLPFNLASSIFLADLPVLGVVASGLALVWLIGNLARGWIQKILLFLASFILSAAVFIYFLDTVCLFVIDQKTTWDEIVKFLIEWESVVGFIKVSHYAGIGLFLLTCLIWIPIGRLSVTIILLVAIAGLLCERYPPRPLPSFLKPYQSEILTGFLKPTLETTGAKEYQAEDIATFQRIPPALIVPQLFPGRHNYILLVIESLSNIDSKRITGIYNSLPNFDRISESGMLFTNFIANTRQSEGAMIALFNGLVPLPFPGSTHDWYEAFSHFPAIPDMLSNEGYHTEAISTFPSSFLNYASYLRTIGFAVVSGRDEVEEFRKAPRITFDSPSDEVLYRVTGQRLKQLRENGKPFFITLFSASSHLPWKDPLSRPGDAQANVWEYVDHQFARFYETLKNDGYFNDGYLLVMGDHRKRAPRPTEEIELFGEASKARVPFLVLGPGIPAGVIDARLFQQADVFTNLGKILQSDSPLSNHPIFLDDPPSDYIAFQQEGSHFPAYPFHLGGAELHWAGTPPSNAKELEFEIHRQRALCQVRLASETQHVRDH